MRTTVTLDPDVEALLQNVMEERGLSFKAALNEAVRAGLTSTRRSAPFRTPTFHLGNPTLNLDQALRLAGELEDEELTRKLASRK